VVVCAFVALLGGEAVRAGQQVFPPGQLVGSIVSRTNPAQHYAVYVPRAYKAGTPVPVLFIMDYRGRARGAAEGFRPAAERYGWILMSSNHTSSDEEPEPSLAALRAMWTDAHDLFSVDSKRLYLAGLSGTARTATWIGFQLKGTLAGVIGASAGFAPDLTPARDLPFLYFGTAGDADYNYWEMRSLERWLTDLGAPHRMEYFAGPHAWMPQSLAMSAVRWMELRAMKAGSRPVDVAIVDEAWWQDLQEVESRREAGRTGAARRRLLAMSRDYDGLRPAEDLQLVFRLSVEVSSEPWQASTAEAEGAAAAAHKARIDESMAIIAKAFPANLSQPVESEGSAIARLRVPERLAAASGTDQAAAGADRRAAYYLELARAVNPDDPFAWYLRASLSARAGRGEEAMTHLSRAVSLGFRTLDALESNKAFDPLRTRPEFQSLVAQVRTVWNAVRLP
jgi:predicted esterase